MSTLVLNIGNSSFFGGLFKGKHLVTSFKCPSKEGIPGLELCLAKELQGQPKPKRSALCSVVPALTEPVCKLLSALTGEKPAVLTANADHGLKIGYKEPSRLGTDRLAAILGAQSLAPKHNLLVVDCGTASTVTALRKDGTLCGGAILPGIGLWADALASQTAQLPRIEPAKPKHALGTSPEEAIASGLFHGHLGALTFLCDSIAHEAFVNESCLIFGTGGNAHLFAKEMLFTSLRPSLILTGLQAFAASSKEHA